MSRLEITVDAIHYDGTNAEAVMSFSKKGRAYSGGGPKLYHGMTNKHGVLKLWRGPFDCDAQVVGIGAWVVIQPCGEMYVLGEDDGFTVIDEEATP